MGEVVKKKKKQFTKTNYKNTGPAVVNSQASNTELSKSAFTVDKWT